MRTSLVLPLAVLAAVGLAAACGGTTSPDPPTASLGGDGGPIDPAEGGALPPTGVPCSVSTLLAARCQECHAAPPRFGAPMPLVTHADLVAPSKSDPSKRVVDRVLERIADDANPMPPPPNARLAQADRDAIATWVSAGAPSIQESCTPGRRPPPNLGVTCTPDLPLAPAVPFEMPAGSGDAYACWGVDVTRPVPTHVTGLVPRIDNANIVHHIVLFESESAYSTTPQACDGGASLQWRMVMAWAPGGKGIELPADVGFPLKTDGSTHYVVQMHYSNPQGLPAQTDTSGFDLCTAPPRAQEADVLAFGTQRISIPPNPPNGGLHSETCSIKVPAGLGGLNLIAAMPHMHKLGTAMSTVLVPAAGGPEVDLGTAPAFSFDTQAWLPISGTTSANDVVRTTCTWKNTTGQPVGFGENTADEMCYSFTVYYPKVQASFWTWAAPALGSSCN